MATKQQLRGNGSKEYQIITNLSRGINNSVADDVLVDNAFRDVVNFSSDQLGNVTKRDNLLNSNFKEFLRKLAYGDFKSNTFINSYNQFVPDERIFGYKAYNYGTVDQIHLQQLYELLFTSRPYIFDTYESTYTGVGKGEDGSVYRVPTFIGMSDYEYQDLTIDTGVVDHTEDMKPRIVMEVTKTPLSGEVGYIETLSFHYEESEELLTILFEGLTVGWTISEDGKYVSKEFNTASYFENVSIPLDTEDNTIFKTSVANGPTGIAGAQPHIIVDYTSSSSTYDLYLYVSNDDESTLYPITGIENSYGWSLMDKEVSSKTTKVAHKQFILGDNVHIDHFTELTIYATSCDPIKALLEYNQLTNNPDNSKYYDNRTFGKIYNMNLKKIVVQQNNNFFESLQNLDKIFKEGDYENNDELDNDVVFECTFIGYADIESSYTDLTLPELSTSKYAKGFSILSEYYMTKRNCFFISKLLFGLTKNYGIFVLANNRTSYDDSILLTDSSLRENVDDLDKFKANLMRDCLDNIFAPTYNKNLYLPTGSDTIINLDLTTSTPAFARETEGLYNLAIPLSPKLFIKYIGMGENVYSPTPYEIKNPGFNLLSDNPLTNISSAGATNKIRGVYYTLGDNVILTEVPCNIPFNINVIYTGDTQPDIPQIRPNNGDLDETSNPYTNLAGVWASSTPSGGIIVFNCFGIDTVESYEMKIEQGDDKYLTYFTPAPYTPKEEYDLSTLKDMVYSCQRAKVINNQLVLFGGAIHTVDEDTGLSSFKTEQVSYNSGYIFFSDFDNFNYFPNYYYININPLPDEYVVDIVYFRQFYAIFTNKRILRMSGDFGADDFEIGPLNDFMGCTNHSTIRQVYNSLYFIGYNGIYSLNQGYLGTGTENLKRIDTQLVSTFNFDNVNYCYVMGNIYIIIMKNGRTWYTYDSDNDMFLRYDYNVGDDSKVTNVNFIETLESNQIYAILAVNKENKNYADNLLLYNFPLAKDANYVYEDAGQGYISSFETPYINLGTPTNTKKFKDLFIKMFNESNSLIPLFITVYVDDILAISPEDYVVELDEETNTYYYYFKVEHNAELLRAQNVLGTLVLGKDTLGDNIIQQLKLKINAKGRAIKIIVADGYDYPNKDNSDIIKYRNNKQFRVSTIGIVYKLKKVKEG